MRSFKPIRIFWQDGVSRKQIELIISSVEYFLKIAGAGDRIKIVYGKSLDLEEYKYKALGKNRFGKISSLACLNDLLKINKEISDNYYILVATKDSFFFREDKKYLPAIGWGQSEGGGLVFVGNTADIYDEAFKKNVIAVTLYELKHVFEAPPKHCKDIKCTMYPSVNSEHTDIENKPFCETCLRDLRAYFEEANSIL